MTDYPYTYRWNDLQGRKDTACRIVERQRRRGINSEWFLADKLPLATLRLYDLVVIEFEDGTQAQVRRPAIIRRKSA